MGKGEQTRQAILDRAMTLAAAIGLEGLTIGRLADELKLSKSGLFAHFRSKESLQLQVLANAAAEFTEGVIRPAIQAPRGLPRVQSLFEQWLAWVKPSQGSGGCIFISASAELDDRPGTVRDYLVETQRQWSETRARVVRSAVEEGHFRRDLDCEQFSHDWFGVMAAYHQAARLLGDPRAEARARTAFRALIESALAAAPSRKASSKPRPNKKN